MKFGAKTSLDVDGQVETGSLAMSNGLIAFESKAKVLCLLLLKR